MASDQEEQPARIPPARDEIEFKQSAGQESAAFATMETLFRTMAQRPALAQQSMQLLETAMREGSVEPRLKELLAVRVSQVNHCHY